MGGHYYSHFIGKKTEAKKGKQFSQGWLACKRQNYFRTSKPMFICFFIIKKVPFNEEGVGQYDFSAYVTDTVLGAWHQPH